MHPQVRTLALALACILLSGRGAADVRDSAQERALSLAEGTPAIVLPREDWVLGGERVRADRAVVYYLLSSEKRAVTLSVYINSVPSSQDAASLLTSSLSNPTYKSAKDTTRVDVGQFRAAHFHIEHAAPRPMVQTHVQASAMVGGHWFDVHISKAGQEKPDPAPLLELLGSIKLGPK